MKLCIMALYKCVYYHSNYYYYGGGVGTVALQRVNHLLVVERLIFLIALIMRLIFLIAC